MVRAPFALFHTAPILGVRKPFLNLPAISTQSPNWTSSSYPYLNNRLRYAWRTTAQSIKSISALETSFSPAKTIEALRHHRWSGSYLSIKDWSLIPRIGRTLHLLIYHWNICFKCHRVSWSYCQDAVSYPSHRGSCNTYHETGPSAWAPRHHVGCTFLLCKVPYFRWFIV
jgi:hypothetical protein